MGILRFLLALSVIASHASGIGIPMPKSNAFPLWGMYLIDGRQSVALFFIISGFYMALVLNTKYKNETLKFYLNRFLRLWPTYIVVFVLAFLFTPTGTNILNLLKDCSFTTKAYVWICNIFILGTDSFWLLSLDNCHLIYHPAFINPDSNGATLLMNQPAFSISIEIIFYLMAPFILKSLKKTWLFFLVGIAYFIFIELTNNVNMVYQYHLIPSSFLYFALGALAWHYTKMHTIELTNKKIILVFFACLGLMFIYTLFSMILILAFTFVVPKLFELTKHSKADRFIGELSYPLYVVHFPVLICLWNKGVATNIIGITCFSITLVISIIIHLALEKPIDKWRQRSISH